MKYIIRFCFICVALCGAGFLTAEYYFQRTLPREPDERTGHVIPRNNHGLVVYYTDTEMWISRGFFSGGFVFGVIGGLLSRRERRLGRE